jgi:radical SAM superfamily enzyme YgiQ (UPF0313 family)
MTKFPVFPSRGDVSDGRGEPASHLPVVSHPLGSNARVLLSSVFGPYAQDDEFGSRRINPMELWHNQVTRVQGPFSVRMFHRSWGLMLIQANMSAPCTCLDFPSLDRFIDELRTNRYDIIGLSGIVANFGKIQKMCKLVREYQPQATLVVGGHITGIPDLADRIDADHIVRGDGVRWFRHFLGEDEEQPLKHPVVHAGVGGRVMGFNFPNEKGFGSATLIPSVGCPMGCNFCCTSALFGGKGNAIHFFESGEDLFRLMCGIEKELGVQAFFVMDENFLLNRKRALRLLELMREHDKAWVLYVFSSANALRKYTSEELVALGISWLWIGLEGKDSQYHKTTGVDTHEMVRQLQANGTRVLGSTIIGLEEHTPDNIDHAIDHAVSHCTDFHQFMLYMPMAGTPLWHEMTAKGVMLSPEEMPEADMHGQFKFNYRHPGIPAGKETDLLLRAFNEDFRINGPSVLRMVRTAFRGYQRHKRHPEPRVRRRFKWEVQGFATVYAGALWAAKRWFADNPELVAKLDELLREIHREFGWWSRLVTPVLGRIVLRALKKEQRQLANGHKFEPPTFYESNFDPPTDAAFGLRRQRWIAV